ncbi:MAG: hypothetical protein BMS9Abin17_0953 [Acidimicrobiia bacterium]|nr:MAG: hypothetical protein BMS9Abin17_0953 [Acidimicrobiia bacterium]
MMRRFSVLLVVLGLVAAACSSTDEISAESCAEIADETMSLFQRLIDDVDAEFGDLTVQELIDSGGDLPSIKSFEEDAAMIDEIASGLGCSQSDISSAVDARVGELTAETDLGRFLIGAIRSGGL